jgi:hypothetical protein
MKRTIFGLAAAAIAICSFAFTIAKESLADSYFEFDYAHYSPTIANVQDESKWVKVSDLGTCNNNQVKACRIEVANMYVSGSTLLSTAAITAQESSTNIAYVQSGNIVNIRNKN